MRVPRVLGIVLLSVLFAVVSQAYAQDTGGMKTVLTNCVVIDCTGKPPMEDMTVVITDDTITEIRKGTYSQSPGEKNVRVFDLKGSYVLPGLWNVHTHIGDLILDLKNILPNEPSPPALIRAGRNCMDALRRGFVGIRNVGDRDYMDVFWGEAFDSGVFVGPRVFACGNEITATGGHGTDRRFGVVAIEIDGPYEMRSAIREHTKHRVNWIKIMAGELQQDELEAAVETAHQRGLRITADAGEPVAGRAVKAGVDCIEHGDGLTDETIKMMAEKGTFYCPTIVCNLSAEYIAERERKIAELGLPEDPAAVEGRVLVTRADERSPRTALEQRDVLKRAVKAGVKICAGSDSNPVGEFGLLEIEQLVFSGMTEMQALIAATRNCADLCEVLDRLGTVEEGKLADLIVVSDSPLDNISNLRKLEMVFKDGKPVNLEKDEGQTSWWKLYLLE
jgi:imidazolonepropionase-like amidohydrolase